MRITALLLIALPLVEIAGFIVVGKAVGIAATLGLIILSTVAGLALLRIHGLGMIRKLREEGQAGTDPGKAFVHGAMIAAAAVFFIIPGFVTDLIGLLLLLPFTRNFVWSRLGARTVFFSSRQKYYAASGSGSQREQSLTIDLQEADFRREPDNNSPWHVKKEHD
ncbi:FxsA family protein [Ciceribacter azotifigens]|uniref:FxsA family protein n=1 Tax=Ciceribacter azotifigens TaxID=2069303 RepID=UPI003A8BA77D